MTSILLMAIGVGIATVLLGSAAMYFLIPSDDVLSPQEKKCQQIANEGYRIHTIYPDSSPDELLEEDMKRLLYLDNLWMKECVSVLPADSVFSIINNVERDFSHNE
ncbi:hypothetical protein JYT57_01495 [Nitrosarchaeum koreense]|nr:hypothetical protein [Nitrosarchaeum koreense]